MIIGIGSDIIKTARVIRLLKLNRQRFLQKIFTTLEINLLQNILNEKRLVGYIAKRFSAKEAFSKALGTGIGKHLSFKDIEILKDIRGKPYFKYGLSLEIFIQKNYGENIQIHLSMSDELDYAQAFVVIEKI